MNAQRKVQIRQFLEYGYAVGMFNASRARRKCQEALHAGLGRDEGLSQARAMDPAQREMLVWFCSGGLVLSLLHFAHLF